MKINKIRIRNFKSIKDCELKLSDNLHCLVGQNESGKSNILLALTYLNFEYNKLTETLQNLSIENNPFKYPILNAYFEFNSIKIIQEFKTILAQTFHAKEELFNDRLNQFILNIAGPNAEDISIELLSSKTKPEIVITSDNTQTKPVFDFISNNMPLFQYFENENFDISPLDISILLNNPEDPSISSFRKLLEIGGLTDFTLIDISNPSNFNRLKRRIVNNINKIINTYYSQNDHLKITLESVNNYITMHIEEPHFFSNFTDHSNGFKYFFSFLINKIHSNEFKNRRIFYLLDEPALNLHPKGQKDFLKILGDISKESQIIYTTHSPFSINRLHPLRVLCVSNSIETGTIIEPKAYSKNWRPLRTSLGIDISDSFFYADKTLLVEGPEDKIYLSTMINYYLQSGDINIQNDLFSIMESGGEGNMVAMCQILIEEGRPVVLLLDSDSTRTYNKLVHKSQNTLQPNQIIINQITDFKTNAVSIEDLLDLNVLSKAISHSLAYLIEDNQIALKDNHKTPIPDLTNIHPPGTYKKFADYFHDYFHCVGDENNHKSVPISKLIIAHEYDKIIKKGHIIIDNETKIIQLNLLNKILKDLNIN